jgi:hypothetical protein
MEEISFAVVTKPYEPWNFYDNSSSGSSHDAVVPKESEESSPQKKINGKQDVGMRKTLFETESSHDKWIEYSGPELSYPVSILKTRRRSDINAADKQTVADLDSEARRLLLICGSISRLLNSEPEVYTKLLNCAFGSVGTTSEALEFMERRAATEETFTDVLVVEKHSSAVNVPPHEFRRRVSEIRLRGQLTILDVYMSRLPGNDSVGAPVSPENLRRTLQQFGWQFRTTPKADDQTDTPWWKFWGKLGGK